MLLPKFGGTSDEEVEDFLYTFMTVLMRGKSEEDKAYSVLVYMKVMQRGSIKQSSSMAGL